MKYYTEWIIEMGKDLLSNLVSARACMVPKSILYSNKEEWGGKHKQGGKLNEELHASGPLTVFSHRLDGLQIDLRLGNWKSSSLMLIYALNTGDKMKYTIQGDWL